LVDGHPIAAYRGAYLSEGRVFAAVAPLMTDLADRVRWEGATLVIERGGRDVRVRLPNTAANELDAAYLPAAPVLRALGATVRYEPATRRLIVSIAYRRVPASPTPFNAVAPQVSPGAVFTPSPAPTPKPLWTGSPLPRRTALPLPPPALRHTRAN
jgi:hypothetical protein